MQNSQQTLDQEMQRRGRKIFLLMLVFFIVPIIIVVMMYKLDWKPKGESLGEMVTPPRLLSTVSALKNNDGVVLPSQFWKDKWSIVYVAAECQQKCLDQLHNMRQLHVSLYKEMDRVQRVLITTSQDVTNIKRDYPDLIIINAPVSDVDRFSQQFQVSNENVSLSNRIYLVDPLGHLMMSYPEDLPLADVRKDLTRLLRYSWAG